MTEGTVTADLTDAYSEVLRLNVRYAKYVTLVITNTDTDNALDYKIESNAVYGSTALITDVAETEVAAEGSASQALKEYVRAEIIVSAKASVAEATSAISIDYQYVE